MSEQGIVSQDRLPEVKIVVKGAKWLRSLFVYGRLPEDVLNIIRAALSGSINGEQAEPIRAPRRRRARQTQPIIEDQGVGS